MIRSVPITLLALGATLSSAATQDLPIRVRAPEGSAVFLLFSTGRGPGLELPAVGGTFRLDAAALVVVQGAPPDARGFSRTTIPGAAALPASLLHLQPLVVAPEGAAFGRISRPIEDLSLDALERSLPPLGPLGSAGPFVFGLTRAQILETARHYVTAPLDDERLLARLRRPFDRAACADLAADTGLEGSLLHLRAVWTRQLQRAPLADVTAFATADAARREAEHFAHSFPNGIPDDDEFWGKQTAQELTTVCEKVTTSSSGNRRVKLKLVLYDYGFYAYAGAGAYSYKKVLGIWWSNKADEIKVSGTACGSSTCGSLYDKDYDDNRAADGEYVFGTAGSYWVTATATATWSGWGTLSTSASCST